MSVVAGGAGVYAATMDMLLSRLRGSLVQAIGLGLAAGCGPTPGVSDESGTTTTDAGTTAATTSSTTGTSDVPVTVTGDPPTTSTTSDTSTDPTAGVTSGASSTTSSTTGDTTGAVTATDTSETSDTGEPGETTDTTGFETTTGGPLCEPLGSLGPQISEEEAEMNPGCDVVFGDFDCWYLHRVCAPMPEGGCEACAPDCVGPLPLICEAEVVPEIACGPYTEGDQCCNIVSWHSFCGGDGRPFVVDAVARTAPSQRRSDWRGEPVHQDMSVGTALEGAQRRELAALWTRDALAEHASIASFARFTLQLLAHGAPAALVAAACAAQADEVEHARLCFAAARMYGADVGPGALAIDGALAGPQALADLAAATVVEGCIGETLAAAELERAASGCVDEDTRALLLRLAADEHRHALLAWRTVQWALSVGGAAVARAVRDAFATTTALALAPAGVDRMPAELLRRHGRLPASERATLVRRCVREVLGPCAAVLLQGSVAQHEVRASC